ncbi:MAG TPA: sugar phosphate isomerase/epimerase family protein [Coxiellaceae bacterium]|nr:sugar phosphate isomerase/epimerase family protein [Coxiellaceae bacterium]
MHPPFVTGFSAQDYLTAEAGIESAHQNNAKHWYIDVSLESERPDQWNSDRINHIVQQCDAYDMSPIIHGNFKAPLSSDVDELRLVSLEYVKKEIELAKNLNAPLIIHGGAIVEPRLVTIVKKKALDNFILSVEFLLNYAEKLGVEIYLENLSNYQHYSPFHYIFTYPEEVSRVLEKIPEAKIFFDVGHANIGNDPISFFEQFHRSIVGMSFSNNNGLKDQHYGLLNGEINYYQIVEKILNVKWEGIIAFETRGKTVMQSIHELNEICISVTKKRAA